MPGRERKKIVFGIIAFSALLMFGMIAGCSNEASVIKSPVLLPDEFSKSGSEILPDQWWHSFNDPQLDQLIQEALGDNFSIRLAWDRLTQAEQVAIKAGASRFPAVDYKGSAKRTRQETGNNKTYSSLYTAGLVLSYEVDLWRHVSSARQAALLDAEAAREDVYTVAITLTSSVAKTWYQLTEAKQSLSVLNKQLETNQKVLDLITIRFRKSQVTAADVYRQKQLVSSTQGKIIQASENIVLLQHQLSVLLGKNPETRWSDEDVRFVDLSGLPQISVPSVLMQTRPDVVRAFKAIQAADKRVAVAVAAQYPAISISSTVETSASKAHDLFDDWLANLAANLTGPLFNAGSNKAEVKRTKAVVSEKINNYAQAVLAALKEVEDAINQEYYQKQYVENLRTQLQLAQQVYQRTKQSYMKGSLDYLRVLDALVLQQNLEITELAAQRILLDRRIDICKAMAGSWDIQRPESAKVSREKITSK